MSTSSEHDSIWPDLLKQISAEVLSDPKFMEHDWPQFMSSEQKKTGWLGFAGASESNLQELEQRLGVTLPPSYRAFLSASDGFGPINCFIWRLYPSVEVDWLVNKDKSIVEMWEADAAEFSVSDEDYFDPENMENAQYTRGEYFRGCLMISGWGDAGFLALNPAVVCNGEWEVWHFANWYPGAVRYHSFAELMQKSLESYREIKQG